MTLILKITMKSADERLVRNLAKQIQLLELMEYIETIELLEEHTHSRSRNPKEPV